MRVQFIKNDDVPESSRFLSFSSRPSPLRSTVRTHGAPSARLGQRISRGNRVCGRCGAFLGAMPPKNKTISNYKPWPVVRSPFCP